MSDERDSQHPAGENAAEAVERAARGGHQDQVLVEAFIEIPRGSRNKFEYDEEQDTWHLDRVLYSAVHYPTDYGWIPETLAEDGDHLDILVLVQEPTFPGCRIQARPLGGLEMSDEEGRDFKVLAVPDKDPRFSHYRSFAEVGPHWLREIDTFFKTYKQLEDKETEVLGWHGMDVALGEIQACRKRYQQNHTRA